MKLETNKKFRKIARDFVGRIELMKKTPIKKIEAIFLELYELGLQDYIQREKTRFPNITYKEIIINMYDLHDKLKGRKK